VTDRYEQFDGALTMESKQQDVCWNFASEHKSLLLPPMATQLAHIVFASIHCVSLKQWHAISCSIDILVGCNCLCNFDTAV
jgi:hypothetical protein